MPIHAAQIWREGIFHRLPTRGLIGAVSGHELPLISHFALLQRYPERFLCGNLTMVLMWPMGYEPQTCPLVQVVSISPQFATSHLRSRHGFAGGHGAFGSRDIGFADGAVDFAGGGGGFEAVGE